MFFIVWPKLKLERKYFLELTQFCLKLYQVFAASSAGFQCTGFEINPILVAFAQSKALWRGVRASQAVFLKKDFWKVY